MRWIPVLVALALLATAASVGALGADDGPVDVALLKQRIDVLDLEVAYLRQREVDLTAYSVLQAEQGKAFERRLATVRADGFTMAAISSTSREALLASLEQVAKSLQQGVPTPTEAQARLLEQIERLKKAR